MMKEVAIAKRRQRLLPLSRSQTLNRSYHLEAAVNMSVEHHHHVVHHLLHLVIEVQQVFHVVHLQLGYLLLQLPPRLQCAFPAQMPLNLALVNVPGTQQCGGRHFLPIT
jgi:hypothetical protein